jgi:hypothetical protein
MGEEQGKYTITQPTLVFIPKSFLHTPLNFRVINKPLLFGMLLLTPRYTKTEQDGKEYFYDGPGINVNPKSTDITS